MATTIAFKGFEHMPRWRPESPTIVASASAMAMCYDKRNNSAKHPYAYFLRSAINFDYFNPASGYGDWVPLVSPGLTGAFGAGAGCVFHPTQGPRGTLAAGATTSSVTLTTVLPAAVGVNQLANRGDGLGFIIRICSNTAAASGKTEERRIIANTSGTTPIITLDSPLSFTPASGAIYEILAGRVFLLSAGTTAAGCWKYYDIATNSYSANLSTTTLAVAIGTDTAMVALSEGHTPYDRIPGEGFLLGGATSDGKNCIQASAAGASTVTGGGMPADLQTNEYRNFQVRIVEDTTNPTAVGQRRVISSHTSGATGVFTVAAWAVTPSAVAKFVIENNDDQIHLRTTAAILIYTYTISTNTWTTNTIAVPVSHGTGVGFEQSFGIQRDAGLNGRHSNLFSFRGGAVSTLDVLDIAGAATGVWSNAITYGNLNQTFTAGTSYAYESATNQGKFLHLNVSGTNRMLRFDMKNRVMDSGIYLANLQGVALLGNKLFISLFIDGTSKVSRLYQILHTSAQMVSTILPQ